MYKLLYFFLFSILLSSCTQEKKGTNLVFQNVIADVYVHKSDLQLNGNKGVWLYNNKLFNGYAFKYYKSGVVSEKIGYFNGKKEGIAQKWYSNGVLKREYYYSKNHINGVSKSYWSNGQLEKEIFYIEFLN